MTESIRQSFVTVLDINRQSRFCKHHLWNARHTHCKLTAEGEFVNTASLLTGIQDAKRGQKVDVWFVEDQAGREEERGRNRRTNDLKIAKKTKTKTQDWFLPPSELGFWSVRIYFYMKWQLTVNRWEIPSLLIQKTEAETPSSFVFKRISFYILLSLGKAGGKKQTN